MGNVVVLGVFVADTAYRADRMPRMGETVLGNSFSLGPGGKGSNQAVAAGRLGADVAMISRLGQDDFAEMALNTWKAAGVTPYVTQSPDDYTGAAYIFIEHAQNNHVSHNLLLIWRHNALTQCKTTVKPALTGLYHGIGLFCPRVKSIPLYRHHGCRSVHRAHFSLHFLHHG